MEEDIRILKENIKNGYIYINCGYTINNALGNLLDAFEKTQKENEELQIIKSGIQVLQTHYANDNTYIIAKRDFINGDYKHLLDDYIPKSKIKDKIKLNYKKVTNLEIQYKKALPRNREKIRENLTKLDGMCMAYIELIKEF